MAAGAAASVLNTMVVPIAPKSDSDEVAMTILFARVSITNSPLPPFASAPSGWSKPAQCHCQCFYLPERKLFSTSKNPKNPIRKSTNFQILKIAICIFEIFLKNFENCSEMKKSYRKCFDLDRKIKTLQTSVRTKDSLSIACAAAPLYNQCQPHACTEHMSHILKMVLLQKFNNVEGAPELEHLQKMWLTWEL